MDSWTPVHQILRTCSSILQLRKGADSIRGEIETLWLSQNAKGMIRVHGKSDEVFMKRETREQKKKEAINDQNLTALTLNKM